MHTEFEATYININKENMRELLKRAGAILVKSEFLQKRVSFEPPVGNKLPKSWVRVRDESDKITLSLKWLDNDTIEGQKEISLEIDNFDQAKILLEKLGCKFNAYQETKRELWQLDGCDITIDEWPFLEPIVEIEGNDEESVKCVSKLLGFNFSEAFFGAVDTLYSRKYNITEDRVNNETPRIVFEEANPFI